MELFTIINNIYISILLYRRNNIALKRKRVVIKDNDFI